MLFELTCLGSASQSPTRERGQGGHVLRWDDELILFDPGEGSQRQLLLAGLSAAAVDRVAITHFHGDHCLGLPGLLQSRSQEANEVAPVYYPGVGQPQFEALLASSVIDHDLRIEPTPLDAEQVVSTPRFDLSCAELSHPVPVLGYRLEGPAARHLLADRLEAAGVRGRDIGVLEANGQLVVGDREVTLNDVSELRSGPSMAFVMDTSLCAGASRLARGVDLLVCEATFMDRDRQLAEAHGHMTAGEAGRLAASSGVGTLVLAHFSNRYDDVGELEDEARRFFPATVAARDLTTVAVKTRPHPMSG